MKFITDNYVSPDPTKGIFPKAYVKDFRKIIEDDRLAISFGLYFLKDEQEVKVNDASLHFSANNQPAILGINPTENERGETIYEKVDLIEHLSGGGKLSDGKILDYGYPTFEFAKQLFTGGSIDTPEISLADHPLKQLAIGFLLEKIIFDMQPIREQFKFETE